MENTGFNISTIHIRKNADVGEKKLILFLIVINLLMTVPLGVYLNLWLDELYSLTTSRLDLASTIHQSIFFELQPPLYFILLNLWLRVNDSIIWARLLSIIFIVITISITFDLSKRYIPNISSVGMVALVALNPFTIYAAIEARPPALGILLSALVLLKFFDGFLTSKPKKQSRALYVIFATCALYTQYYLGFLLVAHALTLFWLKKWNALKSYIFGLSIVGLLLLPILFYIPSQIITHTQNIGIDINNHIHNSSLISSLDISTERLTYFIAPPNALSSLMRKLLRVSVVLILIVTFVKKYRKMTEIQVSIWISALVPTLLCIPLYFLVGDQLMSPRHLVVLFLPTLLLWCWVLSNFNFFFSSLNSILIFSFSFLYLFTTYFNYRSLAKPGDWKRVASYLEKTELPQQPIVVFNGSLAPLLQYYYSGINTIAPIPKERYFQDLQAYRPINEQEIRSLFSCLPTINRSNGLIFLVNDSYLENPDLVNKDLEKELKLKRSNISTSDYNLINLEKFIKQNYLTLTQKDFLLTRVRLLRLKSKIISPFSSRSCR
ncbi:MAG TPA: glycosyltransferase family 39 protein [Stenomitos sp.]